MTHPLYNRREVDTNVLYYGDNLDIMRRYIPDEAIDLVYLDPPFNSNRAYNIIFRDESGNTTDAQLLASSGVEVLSLVDPCS
jgi:site-specific DNA-methyltransferase (adenine-specific)